jgi:hypothetical protein
LTGESRTFPMKDVAYAGPRKDDARPIVAAPPPTPAPEQPRQAEDETVAVRFEAAGPVKDLTLHVRASMSEGIVLNALTMSVGTLDSETYRQVCTAPCEVKMRPDRYKFALSDKNGHPIVVETPVLVKGSTTLYGRFESRQGVRTAGWIVVGVSLLGGLAIALIPPSNSSSGHQDYTISPTLIGLGVGAAGTLFGILLGMVGDDAYVSAD